MEWNGMEWNESERIKGLKIWKCKSEGVKELIN